MKKSLMPFESLIFKIQMEPRTVPSLGSLKFCLEVMRKAVCVLVVFSLIGENHLVTTDSHLVSKS